MKTPLVSYRLHDSTYNFYCMDNLIRAVVELVELNWLSIHTSLPLQHLMSFL